MRLNLIWDLDGTLARSDKRELELVVKRFGEDEVLNGYRPDAYNGRLRYMLPYVGIFAETLWNNPTIYENCPLDENALETIKLIKALGVKQSVHSLSLVPQITEAKKAYAIKEIGLPFSTNVGTTKIYPKMDICVEDYAPNFSESNAKLNILITREWNANDVGNFIRVNSLLEIPQVIKDHFNL